MLVDNLRTIETPEGIALQLRLAGPFVRGLAWAVDAVIRLVIGTAVWFSLLALGKTGVGLILILTFVLVFLYPLLFEVYFAGQTPGKMTMGISAVHDDGTPLGWSGSLIRNLLRGVDILPGTHGLFGPGVYGIGLLCMLIHPEFKRLGDIAAGTVVAYVDKPPVRKPLPAGAAQPLPVALSAEEQRLIVALAERGHVMSGERAIELTELLHPLTGKTGAEGAQTVLAYARWLTGQTGHNSHEPNKDKPSNVARHAFAGVSSTPAANTAEDALLAEALQLADAAPTDSQHDHSDAPR